MSTSAFGDGTASSSSSFDGFQAYTTHEVLSCRDRHYHTNSAIRGAGRGARGLREGNTAPKRDLSLFYERVCVWMLVHLTSPLPLCLCLSLSVSLSVSFSLSLSLLLKLCA